MKKFIFGGVLLISLSASYPILADPTAKKGNDVEFRGEITASLIVQNTCIIKAKKQGKLVPNSDMTRLISYGVGGSAGEITVTSPSRASSIRVELTASQESLTRDDTVVENVSLESGLGSKPRGFRGFRGLGNELAEQPPSISIKPGVKNLALKVWFKAIRIDADEVSVFDTTHNNGKAIFDAGRYKGITTITCQPY